MTRPPMPLLNRGDARALAFPDASVGLSLEPPLLTPNLIQPRKGSGRIEPLSLLFTGSRGYRDKRIVARAVTEAVTRHYPDGIPEPFDWSSVVVRHGAASGLDTLARLLAQAWGMRIESIAADWASCAATCRPGHRKHRRDGVEYCPAAGLRRNTELVALQPLADECLTFAVPTSRGTFDCADKARMAAIPVYDYGVSTRFEDRPKKGLMTRLPAKTKGGYGK